MYCEILASVYNRISFQVNESAHKLDAYLVRSTTYRAYGHVPYTREAD